MRDGHAVLAVTVDSLFAADPPEGLTEYLVFHDSIGNSLTAYSVEGTLTAATVTELDPANEYVMHSVPGFRAVDLVYLAIRGSGSPSVWSDTFVAGVASLLGLFVGLYLSRISRTRDLVHAEVVARTEELAQFAYRTSHDLRGPLVTVSGLARLSIDDLRDGFLDDLPANLQRIDGQVVRLATLVEDILDLAKADLADNELESVDVASVVRDAVESVRLSYSEKLVRIEVEVAVERPLLVMRGRLRQIVENLVSNSVKYADLAKSDPRVAIEVGHSGSRLVLRVEDNGLGIPPDAIAQLFGRFKRFHPHTAVGSGLGLSIVEKHVERLGGRITVVSEEGEGSVFTVEFPSEVS